MTPAEALPHLLNLLAAARDERDAPSGLALADVAAERLEALEVAVMVLEGRVPVTGARPAG